MRLLIIIVFIFCIRINTNAQEIEIKENDYIKDQIQQLEFALKYYTSIDKSGSWQTLIIGRDSLKYAMEKPLVKIALRNNLCLTGDLPEDVITIHSIEEDSAIFYALKHFQFRHGLQESGKMDKETLKAIHTPICDRIEQIKINIKRLRTFLLEGEPLFLLVNIPDYSLKIIKNGSVDLEMKVIVGKKSTPTAQFYGKIEHIILNPSWNVPSSIARNELFPKIRNNPNYLRNNHFKMYSANGRKEVSWEDLDWSRITASTFNYSIEQVPGPWNALGTIKFLFPNNHDIYLHDTPEKGLFQSRRRAFSHGCVRVERPFALADYLLKETTNLGREDLVKFLNKEKTKGIRLDYPVPVSLSYFTCFIDDNLELHFREDIYSLDVFESEDKDFIVGKL